MRLGASMAVWLVLAQGAGGTELVDFNRDIRPILAAKCFACHGPDDEHREGELRLDDRAVALAKQAIVPHQPDASELVRRIESADPELQMPPPAGGKPLTVAEKQLLRSWITAGAPYTQHWAFVPPQSPPLPAVVRSDWCRNPIDRFVLARLEAEQASPAPPADSMTLIRRLYLDLIGIPPTPEEADAFARDQRPDAYERWVDSLLQSPQYGERWARWWLDVARYSDTNGYEKDRPRSMWPYRDWVIRALNRDLSFEQFSVEQLAGDMLPHATQDQWVATGFHRNTMLNEEGGIDPLEFRYHAVVDRVATTGLVWLGLTTGCAQCHNHKYDPLTQRDYYRLFALLNNADEPDLLLHRSREAEERRQQERALAERTQQLAEQFPPAANSVDNPASRAEHLAQSLTRWHAEQRAKQVPWHVLVPQQLKSNLPKLELLADHSIFSSGDITKRDVHTLVFHLPDLARSVSSSNQSAPAPITALRLEVLPDDRLPARGPGRTYYEGRKGDFFLSEFTAEVDGSPIRFAQGSHSYGKIAIGSGSADAKNVYDGIGSTGWSTAEREGEAHQLVLQLAQPLPWVGDLRIEMLFERHFATSLGRYRISATSASGDVQASSIPVELEPLLQQEYTAVTAEGRAKLLQYYLQVAPELASARQAIEVAQRQLPAIPTAMVLQERPADNPRATFIHHRGEYLSTREQVTPGVPDWLRSSTGSAPTNRLEFARWLVSDDNPLVGRVMVNRTWEALWGAGLLRSHGDFGTQSPSPTHPELLDWLAVEFRRQGGSLKQLHRLMVTSATYRQQSSWETPLAQRDPENRWLGRGPRFRLDAEITRDALLSASGLLTNAMFGPSVFPPQPSSVTAIAYGDTSWSPSTGADRYRRSLYTFSKRTAPFAAYAVWDAPSGEQCTAQRDRSNTPLQALTLLNDAMFVEMARGLAQVTEQVGSEARGEAIFRRLLIRPPTDRERQRMKQFYEEQRVRLQAGEVSAADICQSDQATPEEAAWVLLARALMNLDEAITR